MNYKYYIEIFAIRKFQKIKMHIIQLLYIKWMIMHIVITMSGKS